MIPGKDSTMVLPMLCMLLKVMTFPRRTMFNLVMSSNMAEGLLGGCSFLTSDDHVYWTKVHAEIRTLPMINYFTFREATRQTPGILMDTSEGILGRF